MFKRPLIFWITIGFALLCMLTFGWIVTQSLFGPSTDVGGNFCEASNAGYIKQPANTWSNIGFILSGIIMSFLLAKMPLKMNSNLFQQSLFTPIFYSCLVVFLGPGSMAMHATETSIGGAIDMLSMYLIAAFTTAYAIQRFFNAEAWVFVVLFFTVIVICEFIGFYNFPVPIVGHAGSFVFGLFLILSSIFETLNVYVRKKTLEKKYGYLAVFFILLGFTVWNFWHDGSPFCNPGSVFQGHAFWHLSCAVSTFYLFKFYNSEILNS